MRASDLRPTGGGEGGSGEVRADLGSHKPVRGGKRRAGSTASIHSNNNLITVIDYANPKGRVILPRSVDAVSLSQV